MLIGKRRMIYVLAVLVGVLAAEIAIPSGLSSNARDILVALSAGYLGFDAYKKTKVGA